MLTHTNRIVKLLAGLAGVNLVLAVGVSAGAVPRPGEDKVHTVAAAHVDELAAPARQPAVAAPAPQAAPATTTAPAAAPAAKVAPPTTVARPRVTAPPTTKAPARAAAAAPAVTTAPTTPAPTVPARVARRTPSLAEKQSVINELKRQVGGLLLLVSPTTAQIDQAGDQICTAFDNGQTFAQVKATGLSMIPASIAVLPSTADWAVRQAVTLYCPGHANKLV